MTDIVRLAGLMAIVATASFYLFLWAWGEKLPFPIETGPPVGFYGVPKPTDPPAVLSKLSAVKLEELGEQAWHDRSIDPDHSLAVHLLLMAFSKGARSKSAYRLGVAHYRGLGTRRDFKKALYFLTRPELHRHRYAHYYLGLVLGDRANPNRDVKAAKAALLEAQSMGLKPAAAALKKLR